MTCPFCGGAIRGSVCTRCGHRGVVIDQVVPADIGKPVDVGWGFITLNANETVTRTCKGCRATTTSRVYPNGEVARVPFVHDDGCRVMARIESN